MLAPDDNLSAFFIFSTMDIECLLVGPVDEVFSLILEELEPVGVGAPDLHVVGLSRVLNVP